MDDKLMILGVVAGFLGLAWFVYAVFILNKMHKGDDQ